MPATKTAVATSKFYDYDLEPEVDSAQNELNNVSVNFLPGEKEAARVLGVISYNPFSFSQTNGQLGTLIVTNFRISFRSLGDAKSGPYVSKVLHEGDIAFTNIDKILLLTANGRKVHLLPMVNIEPPVEDVEIHCKDFRLQIFCFKLAKFADSKRVLLSLVSYAFPSQVDQLFAFQLDRSFMQECEEVDTVPDYLERDHWQLELERQQAEGFSVTDVNMEFSMCRSLPRFNVVPKNLNVSEFVTEEQRFPVWSCSYKKASLMRVPYTVDPEKRTFLEHGIKCRIGQKLSRKEVYDLTEQLPSARELQTSLDKLRVLCMPTSAREYGAAEVGWYSALDNTRWPDIVLRCLLIATEVASELHYFGTSILLAERDHRDWAPLVSCLVQLMLEPRWRTLMGLQQLIQREWVACGHDFTTRLGLLHTTDPNNGQSPFFLLFLNCVWQLMEMSPSSFEFSETYLVTLWDTACVALFRTFLLSSAEDVHRYCRTARGCSPLPSAWRWSLQFTEERIALFRNPLYALATDEKFKKIASRSQQQQQDRSTVLILPWHACHIALWSACFLRYLTPLHFPGGGSGVRHYTQASAVDDVLALMHEMDNDTPSRPSSVSCASDTPSRPSTVSCASDTPSRPSSVCCASNSNLAEDADGGCHDNQRTSRLSCDSASRAWSHMMPWAFPFVTGNEHAVEELSVALSLAHHARFNTTEPLDEENE